MEAKQVNDKRKRTLHPNGHMSWFIETRLGPKTHAMTISTWWAIIGGIEVKADSRSTCILLMADIIKPSNCELIMTKKASLRVNQIRTGRGTDDPPATIPVVSSPPAYLGTK